ncbi:MAG: YidC/Oxa1 family membrane protein insertase [Clostridia bacterium]|nr:YidC/Oxa1 family membrane protein insertase [Clostridia bacterium]
MEWLFGWLYEPIGAMLAWFSSLFGGKYVFGLILYALLFKLLFLPFSIKQQKNQIKMARLTPKIELIKAKYKGRTDQVTMQKQQQEIMELQQKEGYNPLSGCLPLLLQFPIIIFLYDIIRGPLSYICGLDAEAINSIIETVGYNAANGIDQIQLVGKINSFVAANGWEALSEYQGALAKLPDLTLFGMDLAATPWDSLMNIGSEFSLLFLVPIIAAVLTWLSMFLTRKWNANPATQTGTDAQANASMKMMDFMMPGMTLFMAFGFSGMMGIYWIYQSALGILQSFIIAKAMPLPKYTEEELKEMKKAQKEAEKAARNAAKNAPKVRSLHYIDDEDYETLPEAPKDEKSDKKKPEGEMDIPEI